MEAWMLGPKNNNKINNKKYSEVNIYIIKHNLWAIQIQTVNYYLILNQEQHCFDVWSKHCMKCDHTCCSFHGFSESSSAVFIDSASADS